MPRLRGLVYDLRLRFRSPSEENPMIRSARRPLSLLLLAFALAACEKQPAGGEAAAAPAAAPAADALQTDAQRMGYALGVNVGRQFRQQEFPVDAAAMVKGVQDGFSSEKVALDDQQITEALQKLQETVAQQAEAKQNAAATRNTEEGKAYLAKNATAEGVKTTASGLQYKELTAGTGKKPGAEDTVKVHYRGTLIDGTEFDSSYARGEPVSFPVNAVIPGWTEALQLMPVGSKWQLAIPSELAYGPGGAGDRIGPNATLLFDVELLAIEAPAGE
jgi:FKBP-type peptidyl-prolyl cis-trans isomerase FklB